MKCIDFLFAAAQTQPTTNSSAGAGWWQTNVDEYFDVWSFFFVGAIATIIGIVVWGIITARVWRRGKFLKLLPSIIAHVHHRKVHAAHHIIATLFAFSGVSLVLGFAWAKMFSSKLEVAGYMMTNAGMALGVLTLILTVWTLNQTMKLERLHGERIDRFDELIKDMTEQLTDLIKRYDENRDKSSGIYRVILVTNNPYFGIISYKGRSVTRNFETAFHSLAGSVEAEREASGGAAPSGFRVKIICADQVQLRGFVASYFEGGDECEAKTNDAVTKSEEFLQHLTEKMGNESVVRIPIRVSEAQFAVIGDVVFEFFLEPAGSSDDLWRIRGSNIRATNKIHDRGAADRFERFAHFLEELMQKGKEASPSGNGNTQQTQETALVISGVVTDHGKSAEVATESKEGIAKPSDLPKGS